MKKIGPNTLKKVGTQNRASRIGGGGRGGGLAKKYCFVVLVGQGINSNGWMTIERVQWIVILSYRKHCTQMLLRDQSSISSHEILEWMR